MTRYPRILSTYAARLVARTTLQRRLLRHRLLLAGLTRPRAEYNFHIHRDFNIYDSSTKNSYTHSNNTATTTTTGSYNSKPALVIRSDGPSSVGNKERECTLEHSPQSAEIQPDSATDHAGPTADDVQQRISGSDLTLQHTENHHREYLDQWLVRLAVRMSRPELLPIVIFVTGLAFGKIIGNILGSHSA